MYTDIKLNIKSVPEMNVVQYW